MPTKCRHGELRILAGNKFQIFGAEIRNARMPNSRLYRGTESLNEEEDRRVRVNGVGS